MQVGTVDLQHFLLSVTTALVPKLMLLGRWNILLNLSEVLLA